MPFLYLPLNGAIGAYSLFLFIIPLAFTTYYCYIRLPETRKRPIEEIIDDLTADVDWRGRVKRRNDVDAEEEQQHIHVTKYDESNPLLVNAKGKQ